MPKTLAELQASKYVGLPETTYPLCLAGKVGAEIDELEARLELVQDRPQNARLGGKSEKAKLEQKIEELREVMYDHLVAVRLRAKPGHEWRKFLNEHPPREGQRIDRLLGLDVDAFITDIPEFVVHVNDEPLTDEFWEFIIANAVEGDLRNMMMKLVELHNEGVDIPKSRLSSRSPQEPSDD